MSTTGRSPYRLLLPALVIGFIVVSVIEVWLLTLVGTTIGVPWTLAILVVQAFIGAWLLRNEGRKSWRALVQAYSAGRVPTGHLADAALVLAGGIMIIVPGFFTDIIGLLFLIPASRRFVRKGIGTLLARTSAFPSTLPKTSDDPTVITGEVIDDPPADTDGPSAGNPRT